MTSTPKHDQHPQTWGEDEYLPDLLIQAGRVTGVVEIQQSTGAGETATIEIHASQVLHIAQKLGMVRELSQDEAAAREALQARIRMLERDLRRLGSALILANDRAAELFQNITAMNKRGHEDLGIEVAQAAALSDLLDLYCEEADLPEDDGRPIYPPTTVAQDAARAKAKPPAPAPVAALQRAPAPARAAVKPPAAPAVPGLFDGSQA